jgi:hypothetical protein
MQSQKHPNKVCNLTLRHVPFRGLGPRGDVSASETFGSCIQENSLMIRSMTEDDYIRESKNALLKLCGTEFPDSFLEPFPSKVEKSLILYPYIAGVPDDELMKSIAATASKLGDNGFYLSASFGHLYPELYTYHWYITFDEALNYKEVTLPHIMDYTLYSPQGLWGIVTSDESHGVLGGINSFVDEIIQLNPEVESQALDFIEFWRSVKKLTPQKVNANWMEILLKNTYGKDKAKQLMQGAIWDELSELNRLYPFSPDYKFS